MYKIYIWFGVYCSRDFRRRGFLCRSRLCPHASCPAHPQRLQQLNITDFRDTNRLESDTANPFDFDGFNLHIGNRICYTMGGRMIVQYHSHARKAPQGSHLGGFSIPILRAGLNAQACCLPISRQAICKGSGRLPPP